MRWLLRIVLSLILLIGLLVGTLFLLPADKVAGLASDKLREATGREVTLSGRLSPSLWPQIGVATGPISISNAGWADQTPILAADGMSVGLDLMALLGGDIRVDEIALRRPRILLEKAVDGRVNWALAKTESTGAGNGGDSAAPDTPRPFALEKATIADASLTYIDHATGTRQQIEGLNLTARLPEYHGPADLALSARLNGQDLEATARVAAFGPFLAGETAGLTAEISLAGARGRFDGQAGLAPSASGRVEAEARDIAALFSALGQPAPDLPKGMDRRMAAEGQISFAGSKLSLRNATVQAAGNTVTGQADLDLAAKPRVTAALAASSLDFTTLSDKTAGGGSGAGGRKTSGAGWPETPFDLGTLGALDADVTLTTDSLSAGGLHLGATDLRAQLVDRRLAITLNRVAAYDGAVSGTLVLNGRGDGSVGADLTIARVGMQALLRDLAGYDRLLGAADLRLNLLGAGRSMAAVMGSLSGEGAVSFGKGELRGLDLAGMLRNLDLSYMGEGSKTIFDAISASFTIRNGVLHNDDLTFSAPLMAAEGHGAVDLGRQRLDYRLRPTALPGSDGKGLRVPLMITGPWEDPKFNLDLEALAREELELEQKRKDLEERARAETDKAREKAEQRAAEELGRKEGESLEDALRRKVEEEAVRGLRNLFGGN
ncbi:AsmA protein [Rhodovulum imhoffii]|uniref:AsmA protein n=1 Tax=Rhodovulum imhoffii TaxID=365340 RepID=A0A2T5BT23_9RHOB|nr:AsmA family protein [Rhodovulum imhoffii]PTN02531.1 AsmA protein [Rhodovulum imhoffii]